MSSPVGARALSPLIASQDVTVWVAGLDASPDDVARLSRLLSEDERRRSARYRLPRDAARFVIRRAGLRRILERCLGIEARALVFRYDAHGKPELAWPFDRAGLRFNMAHSEDLALYAVTRGRRVGVDIERLRRLPDLQSLVDRICSPRERQLFRELPPPARPAAFFRCWTRKEAYVKAIGDGLSYPLDRLTVSLPGQAAQPESLEDPSANTGRWTLQTLAPDPDHVAAVAFEGPPAGEVRLLKWNDVR